MNEFRLHFIKKNQGDSSYSKARNGQYRNDPAFRFICMRDSTFLMDHFRLISCQKELVDNTPLCQLNQLHTLHLKVRIVGGKGGFGATLKSQKANQSKITNYDACRDLSGRRLRHVQAQSQLGQWRQKKAEEEKQIGEELKKYEQQEAQMKAGM